jgi:23S rRNA pseudouridine1911/1915/1917 synthase
MAGRWRFEFTLDPDTAAGSRLDVILSARYPQLSRSAAARLVREGAIRVDNRTCKPGSRPAAGSRITGDIPAGEAASAFFAAQHAERISPEPDDIPLAVVYEDEACLAINKPPGLVVHPAPGHSRRTLANALLHHRPELKGLGSAPDRPGILHRLDKDTSGILLVAKTEAAFRAMAGQFKGRRIEKTYLGLVYGRPVEEAGRIDLPIGRHATQRKKMSVHGYARAREAETFWRVKAVYGKTSLLEYTITTGRTHQIRVHSAAVHCPLVGDPVYGMKKPARYLQQDPEMLKILQAHVKRQMLHALQVRFSHPLTGEPVSVEAPIPQDMRTVLAALADYASFTLPG